MTHARTGVVGLALAAFVALAVGGLAAFADSASSTSSPAPSATPVLVTIKDFAYSPKVVSIPVGGSVTWKNVDQAAHTATDKGKAFDSGNLDTGQTYTFTFAKAGTYQILCAYHPSMHGTVVVGAQSSPSPTPDTSGY